MNSNNIPTAIIRFAGDSGDGIQLLGQEWVKSCAQEVNDLSTAPDFPAEIRAPAGTLAGVSGFQIQFASHEVFTAGDEADVLIALNPAALMTNIKTVKKTGLIILNEAAFTKIALKKAAITENPLTSQLLNDYRVLKIDINNIIRQALKDSPLSTKDIQKCKNFFCLGLVSWLYSRSIDKEINSIAQKFKAHPHLVEANTLALKAGFFYGENTETMPEQRVVMKAPLEKGLYRTVTGNKALALGIAASGHLSKLPIFYASYPITPASDILHELSLLMGSSNVHTYQLEDEMAAICSAIGASYAGQLGVTATSGPGFALKAEALGYGVMLELPLVVIDVQRAGPSTGMPTKTEQGDLMQAIYGRSGDSPLPVFAPITPQDCFDIAIDAARIAIDFMTPVVILSDAFTANSSSPWKIASLKDLKEITPQVTPISLPYKPYERKPDTLARAWIKPKTNGLAHQLGGLEKDQMGKVSYLAENHQRMLSLREDKVEGVQKAIAPPTIYGQDQGDILLVGFGGSFGAIRQATKDLINSGVRASHLHIRLLNPLHKQIKDILKGFKKIVVFEQNQGQLIKMLKAKFIMDMEGYHQCVGRPFLVKEITAHIAKIIKGCGHDTE